MKKLFVEGLLVAILLSLIAILDFSSCQTTEPPAAQGKIILEALDASSTEAWLKLRVQELSLPQNITVTRNDTIIENITVDKQDTVIYDEGLLPAKTYKYQASIQPSSHTTIQSSNVAVTTMDTTSHDFNWETFTFGGANGSSVLNDVAVINENDIWAVGEIHTEWTDQYDSNGVWVQPYNAVHWDGQRWELKRIMFYTFCNQTHIAPYPARAVFAFQDGKIAIAQSGSQLRLIENNTIGAIQCLPVSVNAMWGTTSEDFYVVGNNGNIAHYDGSRWEKIESGTDVNLVDIWGTEEGEQIWVCGNEDFKPTLLLKIKDNKIKAIFNSSDYLFVFDNKQISGGIEGVWTNNGNFVYITTWYSIYRKSLYNKTQEVKALKGGNPQTFFGLRSRGTEINNIFTIGAKNLIYHYNGANFKSFQEPSNDQIEYYSLDVKSNITVLCGQKYENGITDKAIITLIK